MPRKLTEDQKLSRQLKTEYKLKVQDLMDAVSESLVRKQIRTFKSVDGDISRVTKWVVGNEYVVDCFFHTVYTIEAFDAQEYHTCLNTSDYSKFAKACKQRVAILAKQKLSQKTR